MDVYCCNKVQCVKVADKIYNYVIKCDQLECNENLCSKRRALIELAPHRFIKFHSENNITEQEIESAIKKHLTNHK